jgi:hydrogenase-4 component B
MWVAHRQTDEAYYASGTYIGIAIAGGMAILMGLFIVYAKLGTLSFGAFGVDSINVAVFSYINAGGDLTWLYVAAVCMFAGFGAKAGAFPVHVWLPQSYTEAPTPATSLLSAVLSKTGVFGILIVTVELLPAQREWAMFVLVIGVITMVLGGIKGVMSGNLKTTLAYSSMSQIGFILVGVGMQGLLNDVLYNLVESEVASEAYEMAVNGTLLHMVNHSIVKLVLFLAAGIVFMNVGSFELNKVKGFGRNKPFLWVVFILAGAGVAGIPLFNGYVSKTLIHESIVEYQSILGALGMGDLASFIKGVEYLFLFSGGLTVAYIFKLFVVLFVEKNDDEAVQREFDEKKCYVSVASKIAVGLCALPIPFIGLLPNVVARGVAGYGFVDSYINYMYEFENAAVNYFSLKNLSGALISIVAGAVVYVLVVRGIMLRKKKGYREIYPKWLDMEKYVYRAVFYTAVPFLLGIISRILDSVVDILVVVLRKTAYSDRALPYELPEGNYVGHSIGRSMERFNMLWCSIRGKEYTPKHYEHKIAIIGEDLFENIRIIERSLSFGLLMFCLGLGLTMMYLLMVN